MPRDDVDLGRRNGALDGITSFRSHAGRLAKRTHASKRSFDATMHASSRFNPRGQERARCARDQGKSSPMIF